jgi:hypothetical protein
MTTFLTRFRDAIYGVLSGFDRIRFRGTQRLLASTPGLGAYLAASGVRLTDFKGYVTGVTDRIRAAVEAEAERIGVAITYVNDPSRSKEQVAEDLAKSAGRATGLRAILSAVEPCRTFFVRKNRATGLLELQNRPGKCLHYYHYWHDAALGPCHVRLQTWFPFTLFVCVNGREMLARALTREGIAFRQRDNCFSWVADLARAQQLLDAQVAVDWAGELTRLLTASHPGWSGWPGMDRPPYWSADQTEWATDVMFRSRAALSRRVPHFLRYAMTGLGCGDVMRFLGRPVTTGGRVFGTFTGEVGTDYVRRPEGARVAFRVNGNGVKFYDKQGSVLRVETTINQARDMKSFRPKESDPDGPKFWLRLRKGVSDLPRRTAISQKANERCLEALAGVATPATLAERAAAVCRRGRWHGRSVRALNPLGVEDRQLLEAVGRGEFLLCGFRNRDIRAHLGHLSAAAVTYRLRLLRAHGVIRKVSGTHRYQVTSRGREFIGSLTTACHTPP